jgi:hypothetical protein
VRAPSASLPCLSPASAAAVVAQNTGLGDTNHGIDLVIGYFDKLPRFDVAEQATLEGDASGVRPLALWPAPRCAPMIIGGRGRLHTGAAICITNCDWEPALGRTATVAVPVRPRVRPPSS